MIMYLYNGNGVKLTKPSQTAQSSYLQEMDAGWIVSPVESGLCSIMY